MKIKITKILNNTITHKLDRILMKFPPYERFVFWTGLNLRNSPSISNSKSIKNNPIKALMIWSKNIRAITGRKKGFICLILTPPRKVNQFSLLLLNRQRRYRSKAPMPNCLTILASLYPAPSIAYKFKFLQPHTKYLPTTPTEALKIPHSISKCTQT